jgi:ubiquinone/menaquinone biosynthesis C-methylase UbiE
MRLLPKKALLKTGDVDHADWNFRPLLGSISRWRFRLVLSLLGPRHFPRLLEIGYGSGVFLPELARHCDELFGLDCHAWHQDVQEILHRSAVQASLVSASMTAMPFEDQAFDCVVAVSTLEFVDDVAAACREVRRVLRPGGTFVVVTPGQSWLVDFGLKMLTGKSAHDDFGERRQRVVPALRKHFRLRQRRTAPPFATFLLHLYTGFQLVR